ncbi:hypothetical protein HID58_037470, partial [Brassica napus]
KNCLSRRKTDLVAECLFNSPECIQDETVDRHNALHLAVVHDRFEVLQVLTGWIQRMSQRDADSIEKRMLRLLLECRSVERNKVNGDDLTFLDILGSQGPRVFLQIPGAKRRRPCQNPIMAPEPRLSWRREDFEKIEDATRKCFFLAAECTCELLAASLPNPMKKTYDFFKSPITFWAYCSTHTRRISSDTSEEACGPHTRPPGGVTQSEGHAVMKQTFFIVLWVSNTIGFCCALFSLTSQRSVSVRFIRVSTGCNLTAAFSVSYRVLCLVPAVFSLCFDGSFPKAMEEPSDSST